MDTYHGTQVSDPYRWLEDPDSPETVQWVKAQNRLTFSFLDKIRGREKIRKRLTQLWDYEKVGLPEEHNGRYFYTRNDGLQNQNVLYWASSLDAEPVVLLDPNTLSEDGTTALTRYSVSDDGKYLAYGLQKAGSDWATFYVREVATGKDLPDRVDWVKFSSATWNKEGNGFYYGRYPAPKENQGLTQANVDQRLYFHRLFTDASKDKIVHETKGQPTWSSHADVSEDGKYLIVSVSKGTDPVNRVYVRQRNRGGFGPFRELIGNFDARYDFIGNQGPLLYFQTDHEAPLGKVVQVDLRRSKKKIAFKDIVPEVDATLESAGIVGGKLVTVYMKDAYSQVFIHELDGSEKRRVALPGIGTASGFHGRMAAKETFYSFSNFTTPTTIYRFDLTSNRASIFRAPTVDFDANKYETKQIFYQSKDGTKIPMFVTHKRGLTLNGDNPTLLYGYGGFNIPLTPTFSVGRLVWLEMGGVLAVANLRGGGEYGQAWHKAGTKLNKQNVFDDFIAAAEWLIREGYTKPKRLAIHGRSNGGLLVGAVMTQRPELFGAALPGVGVLDMLRFHTFTIGFAWIDDYGSSEDPEEFQALYKYSPLHNVKPQAYPPTMITTADHDDRVVPAHSFKFAAELQHKQTGPAPILIRIETKAGHGAGKPTGMKIADVTDKYSFLVETLGIEMEGLLQ